MQGTNTLPTERSIGIINFDYGIGQINFINKLDYNKSDYFVPKVIQVIEIPKLRRERKQRYFPDIKDSSSIALFLKVLNLTHPDLIDSIHRDYLEAGTDFVSAEIGRASCRERV